MRTAGTRRPASIVDCSRANSGKKHVRQEGVWQSVLQQRIEGNDTIVGLMVESHLEEGNQKLEKDGSTGLRHGFDKILIVNGHGSNQPLIDLIARKTVLETDSLCFATGYFTFLMEAFETVRESEIIAHADEFETSLYLHLAPERVRMDKAAKGDDRRGEFVSSDSTSPFIRFNDYWGRWTDLGVHGDPTMATPEKGKLIFEAAVEGMIRAIDEIRAWPIEERRDMHTHPVQKGIRW